MKTIRLARKHFFFSLLFLQLTLHVPARAAGPQYNAIDLGTLGGAASYPSAINATGEIVGASEAVNPNFVAFSDVSGTMKNLLTLGGSTSSALGINDNGLIVGASSTSGTTQHSFAVVNLPLVDINPFGSTFSAATCVNNQGDIAGYYTLSGTFRAFAYLSGTATDLGTLGGSTAVANGINQSGTIVGVSTLAGVSISHAFLYASGTMTDLGVLASGTYSEAIGINDAGQVTGGSQVPFVSTEHAFLYTSGTMADLGTPGAGFIASRGMSVNNYGQVAGSLVTQFNAQSAFLYTSGTMYDLNALVSSSNGLLGLNYSSMGKVINDWGQIAANAPVGGFQHAFLLNPVTPYFYASPNITDTKFVQGMNYGLFTPITGTNTTFGSTARLLDGTVIANRDVVVEMQNVSSAPVLPATGLASDVVRTTGFVGDLHVVEVSYNPATVISNFINAENVQLDWYNLGTGKWVSAAQAGSALTYTFVNGAYNPAVDLHPGYYGIDLVHHKVWAVVESDGLYAAAAGTTLSVKLVAAQSDSIKSGSATLIVAGPPAVGGGIVAFRGTLRPAGTKSNTFAIVGYDSAGNAIVYVETGHTDPVSHTACLKVGDPVAGATSGLGAVVTVQASGTSVTASQTTRIERFDSLPSVAFPTGTPLSGGVTFASYKQFGVYDAPGVAIFGVLRGAGISPADSAAFCMQSGSALNVLIQNGLTLGGLVTANVKSFTALTPLPFVGGQTRSVSQEATAAAALAKVSTGATVVTLSAQGSNTIIAFTGEGIPNMSGVKIATLHEPAVNDNETEAFALTLSGNGVGSKNNSAIAYLTASNGISLAVRTGGPAPDVTGTAAAGTFAKLSDPVLNQNDAIAFIGSLLTSGSTAVPKSTSQGIWSNGDGSLRQIARQGDPTSGITAASFSGFQQLVLPDAQQALFQATFSGGHQKKGNGVWVATPHNGILPIVFTGQNLNFHATTRTVSSIKIFQQPASCLGETRSFDPVTTNTVFQVTFTDHTWAIYQAAFD